jgi:hypothetical protein
LAVGHQVRVHPQRHFDRELAIDTVSLWKTHDALLEAASFSDDLFG